MVDKQNYARYDSFYVTLLLNMETTYSGLKTLLTVKKISFQGQDRYLSEVWLTKEESKLSIRMLMQQVIYYSVSIESCISVDTFEDMFLLVRFNLTWASSMRNSYLRYTLPLFLEIIAFLQQVHLREANTFIDLFIRFIIDTFKD